MSKKIAYTNRDFAGLRQDLVNFTKEYYPDLIQNTNDASIYSVLLDLNAAIADNLHFHIDRVWQETMLDFAQQKQSLFHIAKTYGIRIPGSRPSVALCDFNINVPVKGDKDDDRYEGILRAGAQVSGGGQIFETISDIDFSNPFNEKGETNRLKIPNFDNNNKLISYTITKREPVVNGVTKIFRKAISQRDQKPFVKIYLPEKNVLGVTTIIHKEGTSFAGNPTSSEFITEQNKWYEVQSLVQDKVFVPSKTAVSDKKNFKAGEYIRVNNKFITEYTPEGFFFLTFGSGNVDPLDNLDNYITNNLKVNLSTYLNNMSLGAIPKQDTTLFIKYRIGGGKESNLGVGVINNIENVDFSINGPNQTVNDQVLQSLVVTNITPAVGGSDQPVLEELRGMIAYNFAAQNRAVTINDYESLIRTMPSQFGAPAKVSILEENNKIKIKMLSYDDSGMLTETVSRTLKSNLANYLSNYRMINDYISIESANVIDLGVLIDIILDNTQNQGVVISSIANEISNFFSSGNRQMGQNVNVSELRKNIQNQNGVISISNISFFNPVGKLSTGWSK
jgi:hypothetical protein